MATIDWWEDRRKDKGKYFIRPKIDKNENLFHGIWYGVCIHLKEDGCELSFNARPKGCQILIPHENQIDCYLKGYPKFESEKDLAVYKWRKLSYFLASFRDKA